MAKKPSNRSSMSGLARPKSTSLDGPDNWIKPEAPPTPAPKAQPAAEPARAKPAPAKPAPAAPVQAAPEKKARAANLQIRITEEDAFRLKMWVTQNRTSQQALVEKLILDFLDENEG